MKSPSKWSSEQEEKLGKLARSENENDPTSQVKQLPTLRRTGVDNVPENEQRPLQCYCLISTDRRRKYFLGAAEV